MERVEHRLATTPVDREAVFRLRYDAYLKNGLLPPNPGRRLFDERYDDAANARIVMTFVDGDLAGTTRVNVSSDLSSPLPALGVYPDIVAPHLRAGRTLVEMTRLAGSPDLTSLAAELPYITLRPGFMAAGYFNADFAIATPRGEHMAFYRRVFCFEPWCEPRDYPGLTAKFGCMAANYRAVHQRIKDRYPFFKSTSAECELLFGPADALSSARSQESLAQRPVEAA